ncbi:MAG: type I secretion system permease/ATPase [Desulfobulbaceae bacterium]|nr:type I secretion system permease/ATPase [Desulfobulbaceae bacterium]
MESPDQSLRSGNLAHCLVAYANIYHEPCELEAILADLPIESGAEFPDLLKGAELEAVFSRVADRAGLTSKLLQRPLDKIPKLILPVILLLKDQQACILTGFDDKRQKASIITPESGEAEHFVELEQLQDEYLGFAFGLNRKYHHLNPPDDERTQGNSKGWFWNTLWVSKWIYFDVLVASLAINVFVLAGPLFIMNVYDRVVPNNAVETLWVLAIGVIIAYSFDIILKFTRTYFLEVAAKKSDILLSSRIFSQVMGLKMSCRPKAVGAFASHIKEFDSIRNFLTSTTIATLVDLPFAFLFLLVIASIGGQLVWVPIAMGLLIILYTLSIKNALYRSIEQTYEAAAVKNSILIENLLGMESLKTLGALGQSQYKWEESTHAIAEKGLKSRTLSASITTTTSLLMQLNSVFIVVWGVYLIQELELTMGGLIAVVILSSRTIAPLGQVASLISSYEQTRVAYTALQGIMAKEVERPVSKNFIHKDEWQGEVEFKGVSFTYPETEVAVLNNISFSIEAGEKLAILGKNGSGKTTIEKLLMALYEPDSGAILIDGIDIKQLDPHSLRKKISYVAQDVQLFQGTLKDNLTLGTPGATHKEILAAINLAGLNDYVSQHHNGLDMPIGEGGSNLSAGQRQSIALARALLTDRPIVLLDEPTSAMDATTEAEVLNKLRTELKDKTLILVTHKAALLNLVDRVLLIDRGALLFDGGREQFLQNFMGGEK